MSYIKPLEFFVAEKKQVSRQDRLFYILCNYSWPEKMPPQIVSRNYFFISIYFGVHFDYDMLELIGCSAHVEQLKTWKRYCLDGVIVGNIPEVFEGGRNRMREWIHGRNLTFCDDPVLPSATSNALIFYMTGVTSQSRLYLPPPPHSIGTIAYEALSEISNIKKNDDLSSGD